MTEKRAALDILLRRSGQRSIHFGLLLAISAAALVATIPVAVVALCRHPITPFLTWQLEAVFGLVLPLCCAWDSRVLEGLKRTRLLEMVLLTGISGREWSDGLVRRSLRTALRYGLPLYVVALGAGLVLDPAEAWQPFLWLPLLILLTIIVSYGHQLTSVLHLDWPGRLLVLVGLGLAALGVSASWAMFEPTDWLVNVMALMVLLTSLRRLICGRLESLELKESGLVRTLRRTNRGWNKNPIVIRECQREVRRWYGVVRNYWLLLSFGIPAAWLAMTTRSCVPDLPRFLEFPLLALYTMVAIGATFWGLSRRLFEERRSGTMSLVRISCISPRELVDGWISHALRYRHLDLWVLGGLGLLLVREDHDVNSEWIPYLLALALLTSALLLRATAAAALCACTSSLGWLAIQVRVLQWVIPSPLLVLMAGSPLALFTVPLSACLYLSAHQRALQLLSAGEPGWKTPGAN